MKTPFGIDLSRESTASTFATCVSCFDYALSREADDWQALRLSVIRLRLTRWGEAVNIYSDPLLGQLEPDPEEVENAKRILINIIALFESVPISTRKLVEEQAPPNMRRSAQGLLTILEAIASERPKGTSLLLRGSFALNKQSIHHIVGESSKYIDELEDKFSAVHRQRELWEAEKLRISDEDAIKMLEKAAVGIDSWMSPPNRNIFFGDMIFVGNMGMVCGNIVTGRR